MFDKKPEISTEHDVGYNTFISEIRSDVPYSVPNVPNDREKAHMITIPEISKM